MESSHYSPIVAKEALDLRRTSWPNTHETSSQLPAPGSPAAIFEKLEKDSNMYPPLTLSTGAPPLSSEPPEALAMLLPASLNPDLHLSTPTPSRSLAASGDSTSSLGINHMFNQHSSAPVPIRKPPNPRDISHIPLNRSQLTASDFAVISEANSSFLLTSSSSDRILPPTPVIIESTDLGDETPSMGSFSQASVSPMDSLDSHSRHSRASDPFPMDEITPEPWSETDSAYTRPSTMGSHAPLENPSTSGHPSLVDKLKDEFDHARVKVSGFAQELFQELKSAFADEPNTHPPASNETHASSPSSVPSQMTPATADTTADKTSTGTKADTVTDDEFEELEIHGGSPITMWDTPKVKEGKVDRKLAFDDADTINAGVKAGVVGVGEEIKVATETMKENAIDAKKKLPDEETVRDKLAEGVVEVLDFGAGVALAVDTVAKDFTEAKDSFNPHTFRDDFTTGVSGVGVEIKRAATSVKDDVRDIKNSMDDTWTGYTWR